MRCLPLPEPARPKSACRIEIGEGIPLQGAVRLPFVAIVRWTTAPIAAPCPIPGVSGCAVFVDPDKFPSYGTLYWLAWNNLLASATAALRKW